MKNKIRLLTLIVVMMSFVWSCQKETSINSNNQIDVNKPHSVRIYLTDDQTPVFDSIFIDIQKLEVRVHDDSIGNDRWISLSINPGVYNILRFRNGIDTLFGTGTLPSARVQKVRLTLGDQNRVMKNGQSFPLKVHDNDREVVANLENGNFEIVPPDQVLFWIDFDASRSIQTDNSGSGNNNGYRLKSHIKIFTRSHSGRIEGRVLPRAADPLIMAITGTDTTTAIPEDDGEFKIVGLTAGTYKLFIDGRNNYNDTTINNVIVRNREDTHIPTVTLHQ